MNLRTSVSVAALTAAAALGGVTAQAAAPAATPAAATHAAAAPAATPAAATHAAAAPAATPAAATQAAAQAKGVLVVRPGQLVDAGHGMDMKLTRTERCIGTPPDDWWTCKSVVDGNQPKGTVSLQSSGDASGTFYSPLYIGDRKAARMTVTADGVTYRVNVVTLAGHPGYSTGYVWGGPVDQTPGGANPDVTVYDAAGKVLARL